MHKLNEFLDYTPNLNVYESILTQIHKWINAGMGLK